MSNIVYVLINEAMPGYVKVGKTDDLQQRLRDLYKTSVPLPFECVYAARVKDAAHVEKQVLAGFDHVRVTKRREFFEVDPENIVAVLKLVELEDVTPRDDYVESKEDQDALDSKRARRGVFNFEMLGIKPGSVLTFTRDSEITCTVVDNRQVEFEGEVTSVSASALKLFHRLGYEWETINGLLYWRYEGKTLSEIRRELEEVGTC